MKAYARTVVFDGECGFCRRWVGLGKDLDWFKRLDWKPRLDPALKNIYRRLDSRETLNRRLSIRPDGKTYGGFFAVRDIMRHLPLTFLPSLFLYIPGVSLAGVPVYRWIAENRHHLAGKPGESCKI